MADPLANLLKPPVPAEKPAPWERQWVPEPAVSAVGRGAKPAPWEREWGAPAAPQTPQANEGNWFAEAGKATARGAVGATGSAVRGFGAREFARDPAEEARVKQFMEQLDTVQGMNPAEFRMFERDVTQGIRGAEGGGILDQARKIRAGQVTPEQARSEIDLSFMEKPDVADVPAYQAGQKIGEWGDEQFKVAKDYENSLTTKFFEGLGSTVPFIAASVLPGGSALSMWAGIEMSAGEAVDRAIQAGATPEQIMQAVRVGGIPGITEQLPIETLFERIPLPVYGKFMTALQKVLAQAAAEGGQEAIQQVSQNLISQYVYNPDQDIMEGVAEAAAIGAAVGGGLKVVERGAHRVVRGKPVITPEGGEGESGGGMGPPEEGAAASPEGAGAPEEAAPAPPGAGESVAPPLGAPPAPAVAPEERALLRAAGNTDDMIDTMSRDEVMQEIEGARMVGVQPTPQQIAEAILYAQEQAAAMASEAPTAPQNVQNVQNVQRPQQPMPQVPVTPRQAPAQPMPQVPQTRPLPPVQQLRQEPQTGPAQAPGMENFDEVFSQALADVFQRPDTAPATPKWTTPAGERKMRYTDLGFPATAKGSTAPPSSLVEFLARSGGIRDSKGELRVLDAQQAFIPRAGKLVRVNGGMNLDRAREAAAEAGYIPFESTVPEFLDMIEEDLRGNKVYSQADQDWLQQWRAEQEQAAESERAAVGAEQDEGRFEVSEVDAQDAIELLTELGYDGSRTEALARAWLAIPESGMAAAEAERTRSEAENGTQIEATASERPAPEGSGRDTQEPGGGARAYERGAAGDGSEPEGGARGTGEAGQGGGEPGGAVSGDEPARNRGATPAAEPVGPLARPDARKSLSKSDEKLSGFDQAFDEALNEVAPAPATKSEKTAVSSTKAVAKPTIIRIGGKKFPFSSYKQASEAYRATIEETEATASGRTGPQAPEALLVDENNGSVVGHISYNGKVWPGAPGEWKSGIKPLYDPYAQVKPTEEVGADNKPQAVIPGAERISDKDLAERRMEGKKKARVPQKDAGGLFGDDRLEQDLFAAPQRTAAEAGKSAAKNAAMGLDEVTKGLGKLFGGKGKLSSGLTFDEETYREALPYFKAGVAHFAEAGRDVAEMVKALVRHLAQNGMNRDQIDEMRPYVRRFMEDVTSGKVEIGGENVSSPGQRVEPDRGTGEPVDGLGAQDVQPATGQDGQRPGEGRNPAGARGAQLLGDSVIPDDDAASARGTGDQPVRAEQPGDGRGAAERGGPERSGTDRFQGPDDVRIGTEKLAETASTSRSIKARKAAQKAAESIAVKPGLANIRKTLPMLLPEQQEDVHKAEQRFAKPNAHGMLFTNSTGTGKTFTGLGVVKRYQRQGKTNILILAPSQPILGDWKVSAQFMALDVSILDGINDAGKGIVATTYANAGDNLALLKRKWDLIVVDEAHKLSTNQNGDATAALIKLRAITNHPRGRYDRASMMLDRKIQKLKALRDSDANETEVDALIAEIDRERKALMERFAGEPRTNVVALSATPFAYDKSIDWAEGYLFEYPPSDNGGGYNQASGRDAFMVQHFGYRMRYNKLTKPDKDVRSEVMEREFHEWLKREGALSARALEVDADYDRAFALVDDAVGNKIDEGFKVLSENPKYRPLHDIYMKKFDYLARMRLLEAIKAHHAVDMVKRNLAIGRKVVVFHDYNQGGGFNPFPLMTGANDKIQVKDSDGKWFETTLEQLQQEFYAEFSDAARLDFSMFRSPIETMRGVFGDGVRFFNGTESKKARAAMKEDFNKDGGAVNVIVVQSAAGEAGISLHDTTGKHQRALINLGMPIRPVSAIQQEGRIYRVGQVTNAIFRYLNTGTSWERWTFASKIAERASTAENLAMGEQARALKQGFIDAYQESDAWQIGSPQEGKGGKEADRALVKAITPFERAKAYYFAQGKKTSRNKAREGVDYFATPEPIGLKMVEWADVRPGSKVLEPSAGHGAIARFFPEDSARTAIEPSQELASRVGLNAPGAKVVQERFESHNIVNKYDAIVMNPPFGTGGKMAMDHIRKAMTHLREGGRIVAIIPRGPAAEKQWEKLYDSDAFKGFHWAGEVMMPTAMFERAGTQVATRIMIIDKVATPEVPTMHWNFSGAENINTLFDRIEGAEFRKRQIPEGDQDTQFEGEDGETAQPESPARRPVTAPSEAAGMSVAQFNRTDTGETLYVAKFDDMVDRDAFTAARARAKDFGGYYSRYRGGGAIAGFVFKHADQRDKFIAAMKGDATLNAPRTLNQPARSLLTPVQRNKIQGIIQTVAGLNEVEWHSILRVTDKGGELWGYNFDEAVGQYLPGNDVIRISLTGGADHGTAYHEAFHRLQMLFMNEREEQLLARESDRLRAMVAKHSDLGAAAFDMDQIEVEAEAFAVWSTMQDKRQEGFPLHVGIRRVWQKIRMMVERVRNYLRGEGFMALEDVFEEAKSGRMAQRSLQRDPKTFQPLAQSGAAPVFYSSLTNFIGTARQEVGTAAQWMGMIQNAPGVKAEEIEWSGVEDWLKSHPGKVQKSALLEFLRANQIEVRDVVKGGGADVDSARDQLAALTVEYEAWRNERGYPALSADELMFDIMDERDPHPRDSAEYNRLSKEVSWLQEFGERWNAVERSERSAIDQDETRYDSYRLPGGENYRELLLTLPEPEEREDWRELRDARAKQTFEFVPYDEMSPEKQKSFDVMFGVENDWKRRASKRPKDAFKSGHWNEPNILAHVRFDERVQPAEATASVADIEARILAALNVSDGSHLGNGAPTSALRKGAITEAEAAKFSAAKGFRNTGFKTEIRTLHIDEIQSDWHQQGRKLGYKSAAPVDFIALTARQYLAIDAIERADNFGFDTRGEALVELGRHDDWKERWDTRDMPAEDVEAIQSYLDGMKANRASREGVPNAPFKTTWPELAFKRMLRWAVDNGFDRITWTPGEVQADRYGLETVVSQINWGRQSPEVGNNRLVKMLLKEQGSISLELDSSGKVISSQRGREFEGHHISEVVGEEIARKIDEKPEGALLGNDLRVGGSGMIGFYDKMLPKTVGKMVKKWGGKVSTTKIETGDAKEYVVRNFDGVEVGTAQDIETAENMAADAAGTYSSRRKGQVEVWSVDITPEMREAASAGLPLFQPARPQRGLTPANATTRTVGMRIAEHMKRLNKRDRKTIGDNEGLDDVLHRKLIDYLHPLALLQKQENAPLTELNDAYLNARLMEDTALARSQNMHDKYVTPALERLAKAGAHLNDLHDYLLAMHAPERNRVVGLRHKKGQLFDAVSDPSIAGASGISDNDARAILARLRQDPAKYRAIQDAANDIREMLDASLLDQKRRGLISADAYNLLTQQWHNYVPLKGHDGVDDMGNFTGAGGFDVRGKEHHAALGRYSDAENIIAHAVQQSEDSILRQEKNQVGKAMLRFLNEFDPASDKYAEIFWPGDDDAGIVPDITKARTVMKRKLGKDGKVQWVRMPNPFSNREDALATKVGGKTYWIRFKDPKVGFALRKLSTYEIDSLSRLVRPITVWQSIVNTRANPAFTPVNIIRDVQTGLVHLLDEDFSAKQIGEVFTTIPKAWKAIWRMQAGKPAATEWDRWAREFFDNGGKITFHGYSTLEESLAKMHKDMQNIVEGEAPPKRMFKALLKFVGRVNDAGENGIRLAAYVVARKQHGKTAKESAFLARDLTVDFKKHGEIGPAMNSWYVFFNAAIEGNYNILMRMARSNKVRMAVAGFIFNGLMQHVWNSLMAGDDDDGESFYAKMLRNEPWRLERNFVFFLPGSEKYISIPLPYGYNAFHHAGVMGGALMSGNIDPLESLARTGKVYFDAFNPVGSGSIASIIMPTIGDPALELWRNENFFGGQIYPEPNPFDPAPPPDSTRSWSTTHPWFKWLAEEMNDLTGGNYVEPGWGDIHPDTLEHLWGFASGGLGRFIGKGVETTQRAVEGEFEPKKTPWVRLFYGRIDDDSHRTEYFRIREDVQAAEGYMKDYKSADEATAADAKKFREDHFAELAAVNAFKASEKARREINKDRRKIETNPNLSRTRRKELLDALDKRELTIMKKARNVYTAARKTASK